MSYNKVNGKTSSSEQKTKRILWPKAVFAFDDIMLSPGFYKIVIGLSQDNITFQYVNDVVSMVISDVSDVIDDEQIVNSKSGLILNQTRVEIFEK